MKALKRALSFRDDSESKRAARIHPALLARRATIPLACFPATSEVLWLLYERSTDGADVVVKDGAVDVPVDVVRFGKEIGLIGGLLALAERTTMHLRFAAPPCVHIEDKPPSYARVTDVAVAPGVPRFVDNLCAALRHQTQMADDGESADAERVTVRRTTPEDVTVSFARAKTDYTTIDLSWVAQYTREDADAVDLFLLLDGATRRIHFRVVARVNTVRAEQ